MAFNHTTLFYPDPVHGFNAVVNREPLTKAVAVAPIAHQPAVIAAKTILPAQQVAYAAQPVLAARTILPAQPLAYHAQPLAYHAQPLAYQAQPLAYAAQPVLHQQPLLAKAAYLH